MNYDFELNDIVLCRLVKEGTEENKDIIIQFIRNNYTFAELSL